MIPLIAFEDVGYEFDDGRIIALEHVNLTIEKGESVAIVGPSGSGKTTLIHLMSGIRTPSKGVIRWNGRPVGTTKEWTRLRRFDIGIVFQEFNLLPTLAAHENVEMSLFGTGLRGSERGRRASAALVDVGLAGRATHLPHKLSGGERQRVAIARSIVNKPSLLLADEPTGNLDSANSAAIIDLLFDLHRSQGTTLVMVTHERLHAVRCGRQIDIKDGKVTQSARPGRAREVMV